MTHQGIITLFVAHHWSEHSHCDVSCDVWSERAYTSTAVTSNVIFVSGSCIVRV